MSHTDVLVKQYRHNASNFIQRGYTLFGVKVGVQHATTIVIPQKLDA